jgi:hypothetical protein
LYIVVDSFLNQFFVVLSLEAGTNKKENILDACFDYNCSQYLEINLQNKNKNTLLRGLRGWYGIGYFLFIILEIIKREHL